jgi:hypothetical protein
MSGESNPTEKGGQASESPPPVQIPEPTNTPPPQAAAEKNLNKSEMNAFERSTLRWTRATFWILFITCLFISLQWREMRSGSADTSALAVAAGKQADASKAIADLTAKQFTASQQLIESQRASISVALASVLHPVTFHDGTLSFAFSVSMTNNGRLPANKVKVRYTSYFSQWGDRIFSEPMERQREFCNQPNISRDPHVALRGLTTEDALTIIPGETKPWQINFAVGPPADSDIIQWPPGQPNQTKRVYPIVVGCVDYQSGVMTEPHQTGFIFEIKRGDPRLPTFITFSEDVRRDDVFVDQYFFGQGRSY